MRRWRFGMSPKGLPSGRTSRREPDALAGLMRGRATQKFAHWRQPSCRRVLCPIRDAQRQAVASAPSLRVAAKKTRLLRCSSLHMNNYSPSSCLAQRRSVGRGTPQGIGQHRRTQARAKQHWRCLRLASLRCYAGATLREPSRFCQQRGSWRTYSVLP